MVGDELADNMNNEEKLFSSDENTNTVDVCLDTTLSENELRILLSSKSRTKLDVLPYFPPFKCPFDQCKKVFEDRTRLQKHYRCVFPKVNAISCKLSDIIIKSMLPYLLGKYQYLHIPEETHNALIFLK